MKPCEIHAEIYECSQSNKTSGKKPRGRSKVYRRRSARTPSYWEWIYKRPNLSYDEKLLVWLRGFECLPWKDIRTRYNSEMGLQNSIDSLQMKLGRLERKLQMKYSKDGKPPVESQPEHLMELSFLGQTPDKFLMAQIRIPDIDPEIFEQSLSFDNNLENPGSIGILSSNNFTDLEGYDFGLSLGLDLDPGHFQFLNYDTTN